MPCVAASVSAGANLLAVLAPHRSISSIRWAVRSSHSTNGGYRSALPRLCAAEHLRPADGGLQNAMEACVPSEFAKLMLRATGVPLPLHSRVTTTADRVERS